MSVRAHHISASNTVLITVDIDILIKLGKHVSRRFDRLYLLDRGINILDVHYNCTAAKHTLSERQHKLFINDTIEVKLVLLDGKEALSCYELILCEEISCERQRQTEKRSFLI